MWLIICFIQFLPHDSGDPKKMGYDKNRNTKLGKTLCINRLYFYTETTFKSENYTVKLK